MSHRHTWIAGALGIVALGLIAVGSLCFGTVSLSPVEALTALFSPNSNSARIDAVIWSIRLPRIIVAALVGASLATAGAVMQAILRNPLAEPGITGVSAGAAVGAVAGITLGFGGSVQWGVPVAAFIGAAVVSLILQSVLSARKDLASSTIILVGVSLSALAGAVINVLIANASDDALVRSAMFWLAGDLELRTWNHVALILLPATAGTIFLLTRCRMLDALSLGEQIAATSGVNVTRERTTLLLVTAVMTGAAVAVSGIISFVGLVVPHAIRLSIGAGHAGLLPLCSLGGAVFLVLADTIARTALSPTVIQTGVVAAFVGAPVFLALLLKRGTS